MKKTALIGLATVSVVVLAGCGSGASSSGSSGDSSGGGSSDVGVTATEIHLGTTAPITGAAANYGEGTVAAKAYYDYINDQGGINGRKITFTVADDGYDPSKTVPLTQKLVNQDKIFAMVGAVGTAPQSAVYKRLNDQKVPDELIGSGASLFANPPLPYITTLLPSYPDESTLLAQYIKKTYPGKKVGILYNKGDAGTDFNKSFTTVLGNLLVNTSTFEATDPSLSAQVTNLKNSGAEVVGFFAPPKFLALALQSARGQAWNVPFVAAGPSEDVLKLAGPAAEGLTVISGFKPATNESDPEVKKADDILRKYAPTAQLNSTSIQAIATAEITVEALKAAGKNLTRDSLVKAFNNLYVPQGVWYGPVKMSATVRAAVRCEQISKVTGGVLVPAGDVVCPS